MRNPSKTANALPLQGGDNQKPAPSTVRSMLLSKTVPSYHRFLFESMFRILNCLYTQKEGLKAEKVSFIKELYLQNASMFPLLNIEGTRNKRILYRGPYVISYLV